jgi:hypothetical protein
MKRALVLVLLLLFVLAAVSDAQRRRRRGRRPPPPPPAGLVNTQCKPDIQSIEDCPDAGCTHGNHPFDPLLNEQKNIPSSNETAVDKDFAFLRDLDNPGSDYGHASITLTMDTYSHAMPDMQQGASDKLEQMLFTKTGTQ